MRHRRLAEFDRRLLALVQANARLTAEQPGVRVGLSASACQRRLKRLRETGVIEAEVAVVAPEAAGRALTMFVQVSIEREHSHIVGASQKSLRTTPQAMPSYFATAEADLILQIRVEAGRVRVGNYI